MSQQARLMFFHRICPCTWNPEQYQSPEFTRCSLQLNPWESVALTSTTGRTVELVPYVVESDLVLGHESVRGSRWPWVNGEQVEGGGIGLPWSLVFRAVTSLGVFNAGEGRYNLCPDVRFFATPPIDGAFAQFVTLPEDFAHVLPGSMTFDEGALMEPLSVGVWAARKSSIDASSNVLIAGCGPAGLLTAMVARASGAMSVVLFDINGDRREAAGRLSGLLLRIHPILGAGL